jgi:hypothetical protein
MSSQFTNHLVIDGVVAGAWKGIAGKNGPAIDTQLRRRLSDAERRALDHAAARYRAFLRE